MPTTKTHQTLVWHHPGKIFPVELNDDAATYVCYRDLLSGHWWSMTQNNVADEWLDIRVPEMGWQPLKTQWTEQDIPPVEKPFLYLGKQGFKAAQFESFSPQVRLQWLKDFNVQKWALLEE